MEFEVKKERYYGEFEREIELPEPTDAKSIQVHFQDGLMQVSYPRQNESVAFSEMRENNEHY